MTPRQLINAQLRRLRRYFVTLVIFAVGLAVLLFSFWLALPEHDSDAAALLVIVSAVLIANVLWMHGAGSMARTARIHCPVCNGMLGVGNPGGRQRTLPEKYRLCPYCGVNFDKALDGRELSVEGTSFLARGDETRILRNRVQEDGVTVTGPDEPPRTGS